MIVGVNRFTSDEPERRRAAPARPGDRARAAGAHAGSARLARRDRRRGDGRRGATGRRVGREPASAAAGGTRRPRDHRRALRCPPGALGHVRRKVGRCGRQRLCYLNTSVAGRHVRSRGESWTPPRPRRARHSTRGGCALDARHGWRQGPPHVRRDARLRARRRADRPGDVRGVSSRSVASPRSRSAPSAISQAGRRPSSQRSRPTGCRRGHRRRARRPTSARRSARSTRESGRRSSAGRARSSCGRAAHGEARPSASPARAPRRRSPASRGSSWRCRSRTGRPGSTARPTTTAASSSTRSSRATRS